MARNNRRGITETFIQESVKRNGAYIYQTMKNKRPTKPNTDKITDKECKLATPEYLNITNTETTQLIFSAIEKLDMSSLTKHVGSLLLQARETHTYTSYMNIMLTKY